MTIKEVSERYQIPLEVLEEYERWGLCGAVKPVLGAWQYNDRDLERLSLIMTLHDIGFQNREVEEYMRLLLEEKDTEKRRIEMLDRRREMILDEIHFREKQIDRMDYLRFKLNKSKSDGK